MSWWDAVNHELLVAIVCWVAAQLIKLILNLVQHQKLPLSILLSGGGMPSSHSATVCGLATAVGFDCGLKSPLFGVVCVFAFVVMYDAMGVRRETGDQGRVINRMIDLLAGMGKPIRVEKRFKEVVGHTPFQVFWGAVIGIAIGFLMMGLL